MLCTVQCRPASARTNPLPEGILYKFKSSQAKGDEGGSFNAGVIDFFPIAEGSAPLILVLCAGWGSLIPFHHTH